MIRPGDVVTVEFPGAHLRKRRPAVVVSTAIYHATRPDVVLGLVTSQIPPEVGPTDHVLVDWASAGLRTASMFRAFFTTLSVGAVTVVGHLSENDWQEVRARLRTALAL